MTQSLHPSAQKGFALAAERYQNSRPDYPQMLSPWLQQQLQLSHNSTIIDVGSGTGKFIPDLQRISTDIIAVEPIAAMLEQLKISYPTLRSVQAYSHQLPFSNEFADAISCAQSFHWFANLATLTEFHRVLKDQGLLILIWNQRDINVPWVKALADVLQPLEGDTPRYHNQDWQHIFQQHIYFQPLIQHNFHHSHHGQVEQVVLQRLLSTSFIAALPTAEQQQLKQKFAEIVLQYTQKTATDLIDFPYITYVYVFRKISQNIG